MKVYLVFIFMLSCLTAGCSSVPFAKTDYFLVQDIDPLLIKNKFSELSPKSFKIINTVIFQYRTKHFLSLGYLAIDTNNKSFEIAGMNPMGIKLFEFAGKDRKLEVNNVAEEISKRGDISKIIVEDIHRMYFDQIPSTQSTIHKKKRKIIFSDAKDEGKLEYIFASSIHFEDEKAVGFGQIFSIPKGCVTKLKNI